MAIKLKKNGGFTYASDTGLVSASEMQIADKIYKELKKSISDLEKSLIQDKILMKKRRKKDALRVWFRFGKLLNQIAHKYNIIGTKDEEFFWLSIYDHISSTIHSGPLPKKSKKWKENHFRLCSLMAKDRDWDEVKKIGNWSIWLDIFYNNKILKDERLFNWTYTQINKLREKGLGHKKIRLFLFAISRRFKNIDTTILTDKELKKKLQDIKIQKSLKEYKRSKN